MKKLTIMQLHVKNWFYRKGPTSFLRRWKEEGYRAGYEEGRVWADEEAEMFRSYRSDEDVEEARAAGFREGYASALADAETTPLSSED